MLYIETHGSPRRTGSSYGRAFSSELMTAIETYSPWLIDGSRDLSSALSKLEILVRGEAPDVWGETLGMAEGSGIERDVLLGYRFFTDVRLLMEEGCSVVFVSDSDQGPLLGRNCDLSPRPDADNQVCHISRSDCGMDTASVGWLGLPGPPGLNEAGVSWGGASAHTPAPKGSVGLPGALVGGRVLPYARSLSEAMELVRGKTFLGNPYISIVGDSNGASAVMEFAPGRSPVILKRPKSKAWQVCTNFFQSGLVPMQQEQEYLESAYARYGRMVHQLEALDSPMTLDGLKDLLRDVAQPGVCATGLGGKLKTAYSHISELGNARIHLAPGHPSEEEFRELEL